MRSLRRYLKDYDEYFRFALINHRYKLGKIICSGRMGSVFAAYDMGASSLNEAPKHIAIKLLRKEFIDCPAAIFSFETEYIVGRSLSHSSLVRFFDFCSNPQQTFLVMERLYGQSLDRTRKNLNSRSMQDKIDIFKQFLVSLAFLHENKLTHADLKPSNIFFTQAGNLKLIDLGLSTSPSRNSVDSAYAFSRYYSSPERRAGQNPSFQDDLFAFGCIVIEILSGHYPFVKDEVDKFLYRPCSDIVNLDMDDGIKYWIQKTLSLDPEIRPRDACHLLSELKYIF